MIKMIGTLKVLIRPYGAFVDISQTFGEKVICLLMPVVFQDDEGVFVYMGMDLAFCFYDCLFQRIRKPEHGF
jgi:hypothetical protein